MAEAKLSLSLDDLIKKSQPKGGRGFKVGQPRARVQLKNQSRAKKGAATAAAGSSKAAAKLNSALGVQKPAATKTKPSARAKAQPAAKTRAANQALAAPHGKAGGRGGRRAEKIAKAAAAYIERDSPARAPQRAAQQQAPAGRGGFGAATSGRGAPNGMWQHDLYDEGPVPPRVPRQQTYVTGTKLIISNLDYKVSDADLNELFSVFGPLKKAAVDYDYTGRSLSTAQVVFEVSAHAKAAMQKYNGILLDGQKMRIELASENGIPVKLASGLRVTFPDGSKATLPAKAAAAAAAAPRALQLGLREAQAGGAGGRGGSSSGGRGAGVRGRLRSGVVRNARQQGQGDAMMED